jgi:hypothetical protein
MKNPAKVKHPLRVCESLAGIKFGLSSKKKIYNLAHYVNMLKTLPHPHARSEQKQLAETARAMNRPASGGGIADHYSRSAFDED